MAQNLFFFFNSIGALNPGWFFGAPNNCAAHAWLAFPDVHFPPAGVVVVVSRGWDRAALPDFECDRAIVLLPRAPRIYTSTAMELS